MKKIVKFFFFCCFCLLGSGFLCGCWQYQELEKLAVITGAAADLVKPEDIEQKTQQAQKKHESDIDEAAKDPQGKNEEPAKENKTGDTEKPQQHDGKKVSVYQPEIDKYLVTTETVDLDTKPENTGRALNTAAMGDTILEAARKNTQYVGKDLYWTHLNLFIIGEDMAKDGVQSLLDFICRYYQMKLSTSLMVAKGASGADILKGSNPSERIPSFNIMSTITNNAKHAITYQVKANQFINDMGMQGISTLPAVTIQPDPNNGNPITVFDGIAVFQDYKLIGYLPQQESLYYLFAIGQSNTNLIVPIEKDGQLVASLDIQKSKTKMKYELNEDYSQIQLKLVIQIRANIGENMVFNEQDKQDIQELAALANQNIEERIMHCLQYVQSNFGIDIFNFGAEIEAKQTQLWKTIEQKWNHGLFRDALLQVEVKTEIISGSALKNRIEMGNEG